MHESPWHLFQKPLRMALHLLLSSDCKETVPLAIVTQMHKACSEGCGDGKDKSNASPTRKGNARKKGISGKQWAFGMK